MPPKCSVCGRYALVTEPGHAEGCVAWLGYLMALAAVRLTGG